MPSLISRLLTPEYWNRQCALFFPHEGQYTYGLAKGLSTASFNTYTSGWATTESKNIVHVNNEFDPWITMSVASRSRPGGPQISTDDMPSLVIRGGNHGSDMTSTYWSANDDAAFCVEEAIGHIKRWVGEYYGPYGRERTQRQASHLRYVRWHNGRVSHFHVD